MKQVCCSRLETQQSFHTENGLPDIRDEADSWRASLSTGRPCELCLAWATALQEWLVSSAGLRFLTSCSYRKVGRSCRGEDLGRNLSNTGGLRNPRKAVAKNRSLRAVGVQLRDLLNSCLDKLDERQFEKDPQIGLQSDFVLWARSVIAGSFKADMLPTGLPICNTGVFPATEGVSAAILASRLEGKLLGDEAGGFRNYVSFDEAGARAQEQLDILVQAGRAEQIPSWQKVTERLGPEATLTKMALRHQIERRQDREGAADCNAAGLV